MKSFIILCMSMVFITTYTTFPPLEREKTYLEELNSAFGDKNQGKIVSLVKKEEFKLLNSAMKNAFLVRGASLGYVAAVDALITMGVSVNEQDNRGYTAVRYAALAGHENTLCVLIRAGADLNIVGNDGTSILGAIDWNNPAYKNIISRLVAKGACYIKPI